MLKKLWPFLAWLALTVVMTAFNTKKFRSDDRRMFLPGKTSHGHHQIEMACNACHTPWMGVDEQSCIRCHGTELAAANDSHPKSKFTDPRNADRLTEINAANCVACHREHVPEQTRAIGVTMPDDYCYHCHQQTLEDRPSHKGLAFNSCATAGCHNYHDNTALYESFLVKHATEPAMNLRGQVAAYIAAANRTPEPSKQPRAGHANAPSGVEVTDLVRHEWKSTAHAAAGVNCTHCHMTAPRTSGAPVWTDRPDHTSCATCHETEVAGFLAGMHGMKIAQGLPPMTPGEARLPMKAEAAHRELNCVSCHGSHQFDRRLAAVESCLTCHNDPHSLAYRDSTHYALWQKELAGEALVGTGVSCATCHLPREVHGSGTRARAVVQHNQNLNLRPNEKMLRTVCLDCHGLGFSLDALADQSLVNRNFIGPSSRHVESIDMALRRLMELKKAQPKNKN